MRNAQRRSTRIAKTAKKANPARPADASRRTAEYRETPKTKAQRPRTNKKPATEPEMKAAEQSELFERAVNLFHRRSFAKAKELFERVATGPLPEVAHSARVHARICQQRTDQSAREPATVEEHYNYGVALLNRGELDAARESLEKAIQLAPDSDYVYYALALCFGAQGDLLRAYTSLKRAIELQPRNRAQARNDPDFADLLHQPPLEELLFPERRHSA